MKRLLSWIVFGSLLLSGAAALPFEANQSSAEPSGAVFAVDGSITGAWFDPAFEGAGFLIEVLPNDPAVVYWFTYDDEGGQQWFIGVGDVSGNQIVIQELLITSGGRFGDAFDPSAIFNTPVGQATFTFTGCDSATVDFTVNEASGTQSLQRLTGIVGLYIC